MTSLPGYWQTYLPSKIQTVKALQTEDTFSFIMLADIHYTQPPASLAPKLADVIMNACGIPYAILAGDVQTRRCRPDKETVLSDWEVIEKMLSPIRNRLLQTEGNHDCVYGKLDRDGNGQIDNQYANGAPKPPHLRETYVYSFTPEEIYRRIYSKVEKIPGVHFSENRCAYYIDDPVGKVRYIGLNTQCNEYALQPDGTAKYPKMWLYRFTQPQFDFLIQEALTQNLTEEYAVVVFGHCPLLAKGLGDGELMRGVLTAYRNKTAFRGAYPGTSESVYDAVSVDVDFSKAKGELVGYFAGHVHQDTHKCTDSVNCVTTRCDGHNENTPEDKEVRISGTVSECSFDVFTVNKATRTVYVTKIGAGQDREFAY